MRRIEWVGKKEGEGNRMILHPSQLLRNPMIPIEAGEAVTVVIGSHVGDGADMNQTRIILLLMIIVVIGMGGRESPQGKLLKRK